ncbi:MAG: ABC transporter ATP-binding protein [Deltaproteobacteria bacterium]|nr:MAG: ABC transporter ATP-binding protein [Deltaproteobacteria bacterium]
MTSVIALEDVWLKLGATPVLSGLSLTLEPGEVLALLGPSGAGKTTVVRLILGFIAPERGSVRLNGAVASADGRVLQLPEERNLAVVLQELALWPHLTVAGNLAFGLEARGMPRAVREARIADMTRRVGLAGKEDRRPAHLSGGERQRVAIARALVLDPQAVLFDEPLTNLDVSLKRELLALVHGLLKERGVSALYVTHEPREAVYVGDRIAVVGDGRVVQTGTLDAIRASPANEFVRRLLNDLDWSGVAAT